MENGFFIISPDKLKSRKANSMCKIVIIFIHWFNHVF